MTKTKTFFTAAIFALAAIGAAQAQSLSNVYVQGNIGATKLDVDCSDVDSCDTKDVGMKALVGYKLGEGFSAELGYVNFGKAKASGVDEGDPFKADFKAHSVTLGAAYTYSVTNDFALIGRLGFAFNKVKGSVTYAGEKFSDSESKTKPYFGVGAAYAIDKNIAVGVDVDFTKVGFDGDTATASMVSGFVRYGF